MSRDNDGEYPPTWARVATEASAILRDMARGSRASQSPDWERLPANRVMRLAGLCTGAGDALFLAYSRDGGIYAPVIYRGGERIKLQKRHDVDVMVWVEAWIAYYEK